MKVGIIAGKGEIVLQACSLLYEQKRDISVWNIVPFEQEISLKLKEWNVPTFSLDMYKLAQSCHRLKKEKVTHLLFVGKVEKKSIFSLLGCDKEALSLLARTVYKSDKHILAAVADYACKQGFTIISQEEIFSSFNLPSGRYAWPSSPRVEDEVKKGILIAEQISNAGIGQTVVLKEGCVVAVEAVEGTDACIQRALLLAGKGLVVCKTHDKFHDKRHDLPTLGLATLQGYKQGDIAAIGCMSSTSLILEKDLFVERCYQLQISLIVL